MNLYREFVKVGVIGVGAMGQRHCRVFSNLHHTQLVGVCDTNTSMAHQVAEKYGTSVFSTIEELLSHVDAVSIATPTPAHFHIAQKCLAHGKHVFLEKPMTATVTEAEMLVEMACNSGLVVQIGHIERFNPTYLELTHVLADKQVAAFEFKRLSAYDASNTDVCVVLDLMIHDIDLVLDLMNGAEPDVIEATGVSVFSNTVDHATAQLVFPTGAIFTLIASRITEQKIRTIEATTLDAYVEANLLNKSVRVHRRTFAEYISPNYNGVKYRQESLVESIHVPAFEPLMLELEHFANCIVHRAVPRVTARDGCQAIKIAEAIKARINSHLIHLNNQQRAERRVATLVPA